MDTLLGLVAVAAVLLLAVSLVPPPRGRERRKARDLAALEEQITATTPDWEPDDPRWIERGRELHYARHRIGACSCTTPRTTPR